MSGPRLVAPLLAALAGALPAQEREPVEIDWKPPRSQVSRAGGTGTEKALEAGLTWLVNHQHAAGYWDGDAFDQECARLGKQRCGDPGAASHDVGLTGLCTLALVAAHTNAVRGGFPDEIARAVAWLLEQQDAKTGRIGAQLSHDFLYDHLIATYALCEAYPLLADEEKPAVRRAVDFVLLAKNPYAGWRYDVPPVGDNDTSITTWALAALVAASRHGVVTAEAAIDQGFGWIDAATDRAETGRVGYDNRGSLSARTVPNQHYPREHTEAMTAAGLWSRHLVGELEGQDDLVEKQVALLLARPPVWVTDRPGNDMYYWYHATYALFQQGGREWKAWNKELRPTLTKSQVAKGPAEGSWDPVGPWGYVGGRVYSTALMTLCLEVYFRYPRGELGR